MFKPERQVFTALMNYARLQCKPIEPDQFSYQPVPGINTPTWIIGHLAVCNDYTLGLLGLPNMCSDAWHSRFGPGSQPDQVGLDAPTKDELMVALELGFDAVMGAIYLATPELLVEPQPIDSLRENFKTKGDLLCTLMTSHVGIHLGQLSVWRKLAHYPSVNWPT